MLLSYFSVFFHFFTIFQDFHANEDDKVRVLSYFSSNKSEFSFDLPETYFLLLLNTFNLALLACRPPFLSDTSVNYLNNKYKTVSIEFIVKFEGMSKAFEHFFFI